MIIYITKDDGTVFTTVSTQETYSELKRDDPDYDPTPQEVLDCMLDDVRSDAEILARRELESS